MIISPPFFSEGVVDRNGSDDDPAMTAVNDFELADGVYPIAFDRRWHTGVHLMPANRNDPVRAIADGEVVAYRVTEKAIDGGDGQLDSNPGFVLLKHQTDTGDGRSIVFYSLYMHLLDLGSYPDAGASSLLNALPTFLRNATSDDGVAGSSHLRVYRKDILGVPGACHGQRHIHFEIFMLPGDFRSYFGSTKLDDNQPSTPTGTDYWGHSHFVVPAGSAFKKLPDDADASTHTLHGVAFQSLQDGVNDMPLHIETYFHRGTRYTTTWRVASDGSQTLVAPKPVEEENLEFSLFDRAGALYHSCPSDGYQLMRFGRILGNEASSTTNTATQSDAQTSWLRAAFAQGQEGYIDICASKIVKLSDADFSPIAGWKKISEGTSPYKDDGLCDIDELTKILADVVLPGDLESREYMDEGALCNYLLEHDAIRKKLRNFICLAPTEWNSDTNEDRYKKLKNPDEFYGKQQQTNPDGYANFIKLLEKFQFWDKTSLTDSTLWYFHPLEFIRLFRRCGWLSREELVQTLPTKLLTKDHGHWVWQDIHFGPAAPMLSKTDSGAATRRTELNKAMRKYGITSPSRMACFFGNVLPETQWFQKFYEHSPFWYKPWDGRGYLQLTNFDNYATYWKFHGISISDQLSESMAAAHKRADDHRTLDVHHHKTMYDPTESLSDANTHVPADLISRRNNLPNPYPAADSTGAFWAWTKASSIADQYDAHPDLVRQSIETTSGTKHYYENRAFGSVAGTVNTGHITSSYSSIWGVQGRFLSFSNAQVVFMDALTYSMEDGSTASVPQDFTRREIE